MLWTMTIRRAVAVGAAVVAGAGLAACSSSSNGPSRLATSHVAGNSTTTTTSQAGGGESSTTTTVKVGAPIANHGTAAQAFALSVPVTQANPGPKVACGSFGQEPQRLCASWTNLTPAEKKVLSGWDLGIAYVVSVNIVTPTYAIVKWCGLLHFSGHRGQYWAPAEQSATLANGVWKWTVTNSAGDVVAAVGHFSCQAYVGQNAKA